LETISPDYFSLRIPLHQGRAIGERDGAESPPVAVVSERMARRYWPGESALGRRIKAGAADSDKPWLTIVGVVGEIQYDCWIRNRRRYSTRVTGKRPRAGRPWLLRAAKILY
jgi:hypothetical protein